MTDQYAQKFLLFKLENSKNLSKGKIIEHAAETITNFLLQ